MVRIFLVIIALVFMSAYNIAQTGEAIVPDSVKIETAEKVCSDWLALVDSGKYEESWETASSVFKSALTKERWVETLKNLLPPLGKVTSREIEMKKYTTTLPGIPEGEHVMLVYKTEFENKSNSYETITPMKDTDGEWRVAGYFIK